MIGLPVREVGMVDNGHGLIWRRSPYSHSAHCVEVALTTDMVYMRDSASPDGPWLRFTRAEWSAFLRGLTEPSADG